MRVRMTTSATREQPRTTRTVVRVDRPPPSWPGSESGETSVMLRLAGARSGYSGCLPVQVTRKLPGTQAHVNVVQNKASNWQIVAHL